LLMAIVASLFYHLYNGIRHLFWDIGRGYALPNVTKSGIAVLLLTAASTLIYWFKL
jgi:succinate dehydrogenase / fumarate reductase, cytochrome b subunit